MQKTPVRSVLPSSRSALTEIREEIPQISSRTSKTQPVRTSVPLRKFHYIIKDYDRFGAGSPTWTISAKGPEEPPPIPTPGPGDYEVPTGLINQNKKYVIFSRPQTNYETVTSNIDYYTPPPLEPKPAHIGKLTGIDYVPKTNTPDFCYVPPPFGSGKTTHIAERHNDKIDNSIPGPGKYSPIYSNLKKAPAFSIVKPDTSHSRTRATEPEVLPGPGSYNVEPELPKAPKWTERLRVKPKKQRKDSVSRLTPWEKPKATINL